MNGNKYLLDTNAVLYILSGNEVLADYLYNGILFVSVISEIELLSYKEISTVEESSINNFLQQFSKIGLNDAIKEKSIFIRRNYGLKVPDSIIAASAISMNLPFVTSDKQFKKIKELELLYYDK